MRQKVIRHVTDTGESGYQINQSLVLNNGDSSYLTRTPTSSNGRQVFTFSIWLKRVDITSYQTFYGTGLGTNLSTYDAARFTNTNKIELFGSDAAAFSLSTINAFDSLTDWYHVVISADTTQATASDRINITVNGVAQTLTGSYPSLNYNLSYNGATIPQYIAARRLPGGASRFYIGNACEIYNCTGVAYDATEFGEFIEGVWMPKAPDVVYGDNGFYLNFADSSDIGNDLSGENNDFTPNNLT